MQLIAEGLATGDERNPQSQHQDDRDHRASAMRKLNLTSTRDRPLRHSQQDGRALNQLAASASSAPVGAATEIAKVNDAFHVGHEC